MTDPATSPAPVVPADLEARLAAFESAASPGDFDGTSWVWMILLGVAIPLVLLVVGWRA